MRVVQASHDLDLCVEISATLRRKAGSFDGLQNACGWKDRKEVKGYERPGRGVHVVIS